MTIRSRRPYRFVIRALPGDYRRQHGAELIDTALELRDGNWSVRESMHLLAHGLRSRALVATDASPQVAVTQAVMTTIELLAIGVVATMGSLVVTVESRFSIFYVDRWMIPLVLMTAFALLLRRPKVLVIALTVLTLATNFGLQFPPLRDRTFAVAMILQTLVVATAGVWVVLRGRPRLHPVRSFALVVVLTIVGIAFEPGALGRVFVIWLLGTLVLGLLIARWDPRPLLLVACVMFWQEGVAWVFLLVDPVAPVPLWAWMWRLVVLAAMIGLPWLAVRRLRVAV